MCVCVFVCGVRACLCVRVCERACVRACVRAWVRACARACARACVFHLKNRYADDTYISNIAYTHLLFMQRYGLEGAPHTGS